MEIVVVDDCSTEDDPERVVAELGAGRVDFVRKARNEGAARTFNTCLELSRGHWVHILHGDDFVGDGFYRRVGEVSRQFSDAALIASRYFICDKDGFIGGVSRRLHAYERAVQRSVEPFYFESVLQFASVVITREFYETHGGFREELVHTADWEMWTRAISAGGGVIMPDVLAYYRIFEANDSSRLARSGLNLLDRERLIHLLSRELSDFPIREALDRNLMFAAGQECAFYLAGDRESARNSRAFWVSRAGLAKYLQMRLLLALRTARDKRRPIWRGSSAVR
jgi:GT2 family glycosyltransferase